MTESRIPDPVPPFDADAIKAKLEELAALPEVQSLAAFQTAKRESTVYGAYVIAARLCWAALDEVARLKSAGS